MSFTWFIIFEINHEANVVFRGKKVTVSCVFELKSFVFSLMGVQWE